MIHLNQRNLRPFRKAQIRQMWKGLSSPTSRLAQSAVAPSKKLDVKSHIQVECCPLGHRGHSLLQLYEPKTWVTPTLSVFPVRTVHNL